MKLKIINRNEDLANKLYDSVECLQLIRSMNDYYQQVGFNKPWVGYFVIRDNEVVGTGGFKGKPRDRKVEIAYWTFQQFEGQGIAGFVCKELIKIARLADPALIITATTAPDHNASTKILLNNGFTFSGIVQDDEIGDAWLWTLTN